jgi:hypothetical protein
MEPKPAGIINLVLRGDNAVMRTRTVFKHGWIYALSAPARKFIRQPMGSSHCRRDVTEKWRPFLWLQSDFCSNVRVVTDSGYNWKAQTGDAELNKKRNSWIPN